MKQPLTDENGFKYYDEKPDEYVLCEDIKNFLKLRERAKKWKKENIKRNLGMKYLILNPVTMVYWYRELHEFTNLKRLKAYVDDKNVYILKPQEDDNN